MKKMTLKEAEKRHEFLTHRIEKLEKCIHELEVTANHFYDPIGKTLKSWNTLLSSRDKIKVLLEVDLNESYKLNKLIENLKKNIEL